MEGGSGGREGGREGGGWKECLFVGGGWGAVRFVIRWAIQE